MPVHFKKTILGYGTFGIGYPLKRDGGDWAACCEYCDEKYVGVRQYDCWRGLLRHAYNCPKAPGQIHPVNRSTSAAAKLAESIEARQR